jgi:ABC-2 type transport system ATP-binding protein
VKEGEMQGTHPYQPSIENTYPSQIKEGPDAPDVSNGLAVWSRGLTKAFKGVPVVNQIDLELRQGTIFGFIGPSGSGKTTTIRLLTGTYLPTEGSVRVFGIPPAKFQRKQRERIGYMPQDFVLYPDLTVRENMGFAASLYGVGRGRSKRIHELLDLVELTEHQHKRVNQISGGMQRRLSLASTFIHEPDLVFLDEPTAGIDPILRRKFWDTFRALQAEGSTLFITTQYVSEAAYCDLVGIMNEGRLLIVDKPGNLRRGAIGGEVINVRTASHLEYRHLDSLRRLPFIENVEWVDENGVRILVKNASAEIPKLVDWSKEHDLEIETINQYYPPFEEVFVKVIERYSNEP